MNDIDIKWWWGFALSVYAVLLGIVVWLRKPGEEAGQAVSKLREDLTREVRALGDRMSGEVADLRNEHGRLGARFEFTPRRDEVTEVAGDVKAIKAELKGLVNTQSAQSITLARIESFLLHEHRK